MQGLRRVTALLRLDPNATCDCLGWCGPWSHSSPSRVVKATGKRSFRFDGRNPRGFQQAVLGEAVARTLPTAVEAVAATAVLAAAVAVALFVARQQVDTDDGT
uniref:Uncharacterized protein n=1 Tax=Rhizochromulina marina TaxID=1034831 RepID=A0A7S2WND8_9STRA